MKNYAAEIQAHIEPFDTDERFSILVSDEPASPLSFRHAVGWHARDRYGREIGMAVTLASQFDDASVIARVVREGYEEAAATMPKRQFRQPTTRWAS